MRKKVALKYQEIKDRLENNFSLEVDQLNELQRNYVQLVGNQDQNIEEKISKLRENYSNKLARLDIMHSKYQDLNNKTDLELRIASCNERINFDNEPDGARIRSLNEEQYWNSVFLVHVNIDDKELPQKGRISKGWKFLTDLAEEYASLKSEEFSGDIPYDENGNMVDNRNERQKEIAKEITTKSIRFMYQIAKSIIDGPGWKMPNESILRIPRKTKLSVEELVNEGVIGVIRGLHNYDSERSGSCSTFLAYTAASSMYRSALENMGLLRLPVHVFDRANSVVKEGIGRNDTIKKITKGVKIQPTEGMEDMVDDSTSCPSVIAANIYAGYSNSRINIDYRVGEERGSPSQDRWGDRFLEDCQALDQIEMLDQNELKEGTREILASLTPREEEVIRMRFGVGKRNSKELEEVAKDFYVTRERIRQIEAKALRKLRHPTRKRFFRHHLMA